MKHEQRGIYNVSFNNKNATPIKTDIELIENAIINEVIYYIKGWHNERRDKGRGAEHIKMHLAKGAEGEITLEELLNLGNSIREYLRIFKEPYLEDENKTGKVYEWQDDKGVRFRVAIDKHKGEGLIPPLSPSAGVIITFYSDRNLNKQMEFKNPRVEAYYQQQSQEKPLQEKKKIFSKNPKPTQETRDRLNKKIQSLSNKIKIDKACFNKMGDRDR